MSTIGERLKASRESNGLLQSELARLIGVKSANVISNWEKDVSKPDANKMVRICQVLGISLSYLLDYYGKEKAPSYSDEALRLAGDYDWLDDHGKRILRLVADEEKARLSEEHVKAQTAALQARQEQPEPDKVVYIFPGYSMPMSAGTGQPAGDDEPEELELTKRPPRGTSYIAPISGNSMEPTYHDGDKLFIRSTANIRPGQVGVFLMDGQQWVKELGDGVLISHNPEYAPIAMRDDIKCQGLVLGVCDDGYFED